MKFRHFAIAIGFLLLAGGLYWFTRNTDKPSQPAIAESASPAQGEPADTMAGTTAAEQVSPAPRAGIVDPKQFCTAKSSCYDPLVPNNANELRWMQQYGYPTKDELDRMAQLSDDELEMEAKQGKLTAMTELGSRLVDRNDVNGEKWVYLAQQHGSVYAYYIDAKTEMNHTLGHGLVESGAHLRLAYLLGDYKAATALYQFASKEELDIVELNAIDRRAASLYITYAKNRQPTPRPFE